MKSKLLSTILLLFVLLTISAQNGIIKGKIVDSSSKEPFIGAAAMIKGSTIGSASDLDGNFIIANLKPGVYTITSSYISYKPFEMSNVIVKDGQETFINIELESSNITLKEVVLVAKSNRESENILLLEQKQSLLATQTVGAREMSRKGISNAEGAVAQVSGVSKQDGVKNVFVRGLGDRYNFTTLNGFPIPSEDPEYKNISLDFFGSDVIQNVGVKKAFSGSNYSDVGGAVIDITSKELVGDKEFALEISGGLNSRTIGADFYKTDGVNYWGVSTNVHPGKSNYLSTYNYGNSLEPLLVSNPINTAYGFSGGRSYKLNDKNDVLSFYLIGTYGSGYTYTYEKIFTPNNAGERKRSLVGNKSSQSINQMVLGNLNYLFNSKQRLSYNFVMIHDNSQYVGMYKGLDNEFVSSLQEDAYEEQGFNIRQQTNDNLLIIQQIMANLQLSVNWKMDAGLAYNLVRGLEPDRRVNELFRKNATEYQLLAGDGAHVRNYTELIENDLNGRISFTYKLAPKFNKDISSFSVGYNGRYLTDDFNAYEYSMIVKTLSGVSTIDYLPFDQWFNQTNYSNALFGGAARFSNYQVSKFINAGYFNVDYQFTPKFSINAGLRAEMVMLNIDYHVEGGFNGDGSQPLTPFYLLPSANLKYDINPKNSFRFGLSKTYTLPQSKEISPYQYLGPSFSSQGNPDLKPSDNYNADFKWDYYMSPSELISLGTFYKLIRNPISRAYEMNGAGYFTYKNISNQVSVAGLELEIKKDIIKKVSSTSEKQTKLSAGLNASYIYSNMYLNLRGTAPRYSALEGASPYIANVDLTYDYSVKKLSFVNSVVFKYVSGKIHTIGTGGFEDVIEEAVITLDFVSELKLNKHLGLKLKAKNLLDPAFELTRKVPNSSDIQVINSYKKGLDISFGISYKL